MIEGYQNIKEYLKSNFEEFKNAVVNELIAYYGEQYKDEIISRINDTNFIFYINPKKRRIKRSRSDRRKENFEEIKDNYKKTRLEAKKNGELLNLYNKKSIATRFVCPANETDFTYAYSNGEKEIEKTIFIPLYFVNDEGIIHEMIHAVMASPLGLIENPDCKILKYKIGFITTGDKGEDLLEECMTQIEALMIYEIIKSKGISFIDEFYPNKSFECKYDLFIPSVAKFYKNFKEDIIDARITLNLRRFINKIGKENYCKLIQLLREFEENYFDCDRGIFRELISKTIDQMENNKKLVLK